MELRVEVVQVPVADVDRAKRFYAEQVGFRVDPDMDAAREELVERGVEVSDVVVLGRPGRPGFKHAYFRDPDGNGWALQEIRQN
jgi:catechol 2,3-dioxygenase-like lactoylglutathione lyase family enzyme